MSESQETVKPSKTRQVESRYTKSQLITANRFLATDKDILAVTLADDKTYTLNEAEQAIQAFKAKEVK